MIRRHGEVFEKTSSAQTRANTPKWESRPETTRYEGRWPAISIDPLPCYPPTKTIQS
jgi:hypothetical protein